MDKLPSNLIDGFNAWDVLSTKQETPRRTEVLYDIHPVNSYAALRVNNMKIILGSQGMRNNWYPPPQNSQQEMTPNCGNAVDESLDPCMSELPALISTALHREVYTGTPIVVDCGERPPNALTNCDPAIAPCLFDLDADPCEYNNLASFMPEIVTELLEKLAKYNATAVPQKDEPDDPNSFPIHHCGTWGPWIDLNADQ